MSRLFGFIGTEASGRSFFKVSRPTSTRPFDAIKPLWAGMPKKERPVTGDLVFQPRVKAEIAGDVVLGKKKSC